MTDDEKLEHMRNGDEEVIKAVYLDLRIPFTSWLMKERNIQKEESLEWYHLSFMIFLENIYEGKLTTLSSSLKSYLFAIGRNQYLDNQRKQRRVEKALEQMVKYGQNMPSAEEKEEELQVLQQALEKLGEPCRNLLTLSYYYRYSLAIIKEKLGYKNEHTVSNQKYKCQKRLQRIYNDLQSNKR